MLFGRICLVLVARRTVCDLRRRGGGDDGAWARARLSFLEEGLSRIFRPKG